MKKLFIIPLWIISIYIGVLLTISSTLTNKDSLSILLKSYFKNDLSFQVEKTNWHPLKPSIMLSSFNSNNENHELFIDEISIEFSSFNFLWGELVSKININEVVVINKGDAEQSLNLFNLMSFLKNIEELSIKTLMLYLPDKTNLININLYSSSYQNSLNVKLNINDKEKNTIAVEVFPSENSNGKFMRGYINTNKFSIDKDLMHFICKFCDFTSTLKTQVNFTIFEKKLLSFYGNLELISDKNFFGFSSIQSSFKLKDHRDPYIQVSSVLNKDNQLKVPNFFVNFTENNNRLIFPEINLSEDDLLEKILEDIGINVNLKGILENSIINLEMKKEILQTTIKDLGVRHSSIELEGLVGQLSVSSNKGEILINSPLLKVSLPNFLDDNLELYNFTTSMNFNLSNDNFELYPSSFSSILDGEHIEGLVSFVNIPTEGVGDVNLRISAEKIKDKSALSLFPNTVYLSSTKESIDSLIRCGFFEDISLIYRGPVDGRYIDNSGSFGMWASGRDICLNLSGYKLFNVDTDFSVNNFNLEGKLEEGEFLGSSVESDFKIYKSGSSLSLDLDGLSKGPFSSFLNLMINNLEEVKSGGFHETEFFYSAPIKREFSLLDKSSRLEITSKIEKGKLSVPDLGFNFENIFSSIDYNSETGFKNGYVSLKLNSIPLVLEHNLESKTKDYSFFTSEETIQIQNLLPADLRDSIFGPSTTLIQVAVPSMIRGQDIKRSYIKLKSNLLGTTINLPEPFFKPKGDLTDLNIIFYPSFKEKYSSLKFNLGEIIRGKLNFLNGTTEGFIIAGKQKQSIKTEKGKVSIIGYVEKLDLSLFSSFEESLESTISELEIKKLEINEIVLSNFSLPDTLITSRNSDQFLELFVSNKNLSGTFYLPKKTNRVPLIDLDFINLTFSQSAPGSSFLDVYNNLSTKLKFKTDSLILNSIEYGNWAFDLSRSSSSLNLENIEGTYGKWGLTKNKNNISRLNILKKGLGWQTLLESKIYSGSPEKAFKQIGIDPNFEMDTIFAESDVSWQSLPWEFDYAKVVGDIYFEIEGLLIQNREDLQSQNNILRLVNIFNITDSFEKITNLDFRKLYKSGFGADSVKGSLSVTKNSIQLQKPLIFKSGSSEFRWKGQIGRDEKGYLKILDLEVIMTLPLREYLPAYAFLLGGPITAGVVYIAGKAFERNIDQISSGSWSVTGTLQEPKTDFKGWFEETAR